MSLLVPDPNSFIREPSVLGRLSIRADNAVLYQLRAYRWSRPPDPALLEAGIVVDEAQIRLECAERRAEDVRALLVESLLLQANCAKLPNCEPEHRGD